MTRSVWMILFLALPALGEPVPGAVKDGKQLRSAREEIARLEKELAEQKALLLRILELQAKHDQALLELAQGKGFTPVAVTPPAPVAAPAAASEPTATPAPRAEPTRRAPQVATVTGRLKVSGASGPAYVFLADVKAPPVTGQSIEIRQQDKQFYPRQAVVPRGTKITFPNQDAIFHNVFSVSQGNEFDLGTARKGDPVKSHVVMNPGVLEIFCNMHARMSSTVLVTPSPIFTRVGKDGTFKLEGVPLGTRKISAWAGGNSLATETVEVSASGGEVNLALEVAQPGAHKNKDGQAYGSYDD